MVEVNVVVTLGLACERALFKRLESRNCLAGLLDVCAPMELPAGLLEEASCDTLVCRL